MTWEPITDSHPQTEYLVCNDCLLGWWAVAIRDALGVWHYSDRRQRLKYEPTHFQELPSISPISMRGEQQ